MKIRSTQGVKGVGWGPENALMRVEGVGGPEGCCHGRQQEAVHGAAPLSSPKKAKERFECERMSEKRERQKKEKSPGI